MASEAGVSPATVSRAFSQPDLLVPATVDRVMEAAQRLGYQPNHVARALSTGRAGNIALILPDVTNPFFAALMRGAQAQAYQRGYATFLGDSDETQDLEDLLLGKLATQVDGFVLASPRCDEDRIRAHAARRPMVIINRDITGIDRILIDTATGFAQGVEHLAALGHRVLAYVGAPKASWANQQREKAVLRAAEQRGLQTVQIDAGRPSFEAGRDCVERLLASGVTGVLAVGDEVAQGIMAGLAERGLSVPRDISVIGCDDVIATTTYPPLTTVSGHCAEAGRRAVDLLIDGFEGDAPSPELTVITADLVVRATTGPPKPPGAEPRRRRSREPA